jgi:hypothetical protein
MHEPLHPELINPVFTVAASPTEADPTVNAPQNSANIPAFVHFVVFMTILLSEG